jgi:O-antigen/teichoic acid export membrane protein
MLSRYVTRAAAKIASDVAGKAVTLLVTVLAARTLDRPDFGTFALAMTAGWLLGVASDAGLPAWLARAVAIGSRHAEAAFAVALRARAVLAMAALAAGGLLSFAMAPADSRWAVFVIIAAQVLGAIIETIYHLFRGLERSEVEAGIHAAHRVTVAALAGYVLWQSPSLMALAIALAAPAAIALAAVLTMASRTLARSKAARATAPLAPLAPARLLPSGALPIGLGVLLSALYFRIDVFFVERFHGLEAVAGYNAVFRIVEGLRLLPAAVLVVAFPMMCRADSTRLLQRLSAGLGLAGAVLLVVTALGAAPLVSIVYGTRYLDATPVLRVLAWSLPLLFVNYALTSQVIAWGGQRAYLWTAAAALVVNLAANQMLVPPLGATGAAWATLITELAVSAGCLISLAGTQGAVFGDRHSDGPLSFVPHPERRLPSTGPRAVP